MRLTLAICVLTLAGCIHTRAQSTAVGTSTSIGTSSSGTITGAAAVCQITTTSIPPGTQGVFYTATLASLNCPAARTWSITTGSLPAGLALNASTGVISGTPSGAGSTTFTVKVVGTPSTITDIFDTALTVTASAPGGGPALPSATLLNWDTSVASTPSPNTLVTVGDGSGSPCDQTGGVCSYSTSQIGTALAAVGCGQTLELQNTVMVLPALTKFPNTCDQGNYITIERDVSDATFPAEGTRVSPCYAGMPSSALPGMPSYTCPSPSRHMPLLLKSSASAAFQFGPDAITGHAASYRFIGIQFGRQPNHDLDFGIVAMTNSVGCTTADTACMNHQPDHVIFDRCIIQGDPQRQTTRGIDLGGQWVSVQDSYIYDIFLTFAGGGGDSQVYHGASGKFITNVGFWKMQNNFASASTMGCLFCGNFVAPVSPITNFDGVPHDIWWTKQWFWKNPLWNPQIGQALNETINIEGVNYGPVNDQEFIVTPSATQLQQGNTYALHNVTLNDSGGGLDRMTDVGGAGGVTVDGLACTYTTTTTVGTTPAGTTVTVASVANLAVNRSIFINGAGAGGNNYFGTVTNISGTTLTITPATVTSQPTGTVVFDPVCIPGGDSTHGHILTDRSHSVGSSPYAMQNIVSWSYIACSGPGVPYPDCTGATTAGAHTLVFSKVVSDGRAATMGNNRTLSSTSVITVTAGAPTNQISLSPSAPDLRIQPSYSDAFGNVRQYAYVFFSTLNFSSVSLTYKVDGVVNGNASVGQICLATAAPCSAPGSNDTSVAYLSGTATGNHTISVTSAAGTTTSQVINVTTSAVILGYDLKPFTSKNGWESKCVVRGLFDKSVIENVWGTQATGGFQPGEYILNQPANNGNQTLDGNGVTVGHGPEVIADLTVKDIHGIHGGKGLIVAGLNDGLGIHRVTYYNLLLEDLSGRRWVNGVQKLQFADVVQFTGSGGITAPTWTNALTPLTDNITFDHLTVVGGTVANPGIANWLSVGNNNNQFQLGPFSFTNSIVVAPGSTTFNNNNGDVPNCNTATGSGTSNTEAKAFQGVGNSLSRPCFSTYDLGHNAVADNTAAAGTFSTATIWQPTSVDADLFRNYNNGYAGDYRVVAGGRYDAGGARDASDGSALGADAAGILANDAVVRWGAANPPTIDLVTGAALLATPTRLTNHMHTSGSDTYSFINTDANYPVGYPAGLMGWVKHSTGNPWDIETYDSTYAAKHWITEDGDAADAATCVTNGFSSCFLDPNAYKRFLTPVAMLPRNFTYGTTYTIDTPGPNTFVRTTNCEAAGTSTNINLGDVRSVTTGPYLMSWGGTIDAGAGVAPGATDPNFDSVNGVPTIRNDYYYGGTLSSGTFIDKESTFYPIVAGVPQGRVGWFYYRLVSGTYVLQQFTANTTLTAGAAPLNFPCGAGKSWWH